MPISPNAAIAKRIKEIRQGLGSSWGKPLPQAELARRLGIDKKTVNRWEAGGEISTDNATALAELAGCDVDWILRGQGRPPKAGVAGSGRAVGERSPVPPGSPSLEGAESPSQAADLLEVVAVTSRQLYHAKMWDLDDDLHLQIAAGLEDIVVTQFGERGRQALAPVLAEIRRRRGLPPAGAAARP